MPDLAKEMYVAKASYIATGNPYPKGTDNSNKRTFVKNGY